MAKIPSSITWQAEEYIVKKHNALWYLGLLVVCSGLSALAILLGWWTFLILIVLSGISILIFTLRPPRKINYRLDRNGLTEGKILHHFDEYRAFGIQQEGQHFCAVLIPKKRLAISTKIYFPGNDGEAIVDILGNHLPMEQIKLDLIDKIVNFLHI